MTQPRPVSIDLLTEDTALTVAPAESPASADGAAADDAALRALERVVIITGGTVGGLAFGVSASFGLFLIPISADLGFGRRVIGLAAGVNFFLNGLTSIGWGVASDKLGSVKARRRVYERGRRRARVVVECHARASSRASGRRVTRGRGWLSNPA